MQDKDTLKQFKYTALFSFLDSRSNGRREKIRNLQKLSLVILW